MTYKRKFMTHKRFLIIALLVLLSAFTAPPTRAQFGGHPGDAVLYMMSYRGSGQIQTLPPNATNDSQTAARFRVVDVDTVPFVPSDPFPLSRQVLFNQPDELFQRGVDFDNTVGLHRLYVSNAKFFLLEGLLTFAVPGFNAFSGATDYAFLPVGIDVCCEIALEKVVVLTWSPITWPFMVETDKRGPLVPPEITGFEYLFTTPGLVKIPFLIPWVALRKLHPSGWPDGVDLKLVEADTKVGNTMQLMRLRPGRATPMFRIPGHTHLYVLQGSIVIQPAGRAPVTLPQGFYAYLPQAFALRIFNPKPYDGPVAP